MMMKSMRKNSKKLSWQHPEIPAIQEDRVLDYCDQHGDVHEGVHGKGDLLSPTPGTSRDRSCSLPTVKGRFRLVKCFRR